MARKSSLIRVIVVLAMIPSAQAWDWDVHQYAASEICDHLNCGGCRENMLNGSIAPDRDFKDSVNHHCYNPLWDCPDGDWTCPDRFDCPALEKMEYWLAEARQADGCDRYYAISVASHYYLDAQVFWHRVADEDYDSCHAKFEDLAGKDPANFNITVCGVSATAEELNRHIADFEDKLGKTDSNWIFLLIFVIGLAIVLLIRK
jgi:hypothetical protein